MNANRKYTAILEVHHMLDEALIPHILEQFMDGYQIMILDGDVDGIQHFGSYGESQNLIEIMGGLTVEESEHDSVLGYLTAEEVFKRFKYCYDNKTSIYVEVQDV